MDPFWSNLFRRDLIGGDPVIGMVRHVPIFQDLSQRELRRLRTILHRRAFADGESIVREGEVGAGMYVVGSGQVRITHRGEDGRDHVLAVLGPGDFFGEQALLEETPRTASAIAAGAVEVVGFYRPDLLNLVENDPRRGLRIMLRLSQIIAVRLRHTNRLLKEARLRLHRLEAERVRVADTEHRDAAPVPPQEESSP